jgi:hypothetical protein
VAITAQAAAQPHRRAARGGRVTLDSQQPDNRFLTAPG